MVSGGCQTQVKLLLDTHTFLWWNDASPRLSKKALVLLADPANTLLLSVVSAWELVLKTQTGKLRLSESAQRVCPDAHGALCDGSVTGDACPSYWQPSQLPLHHRDPFDRLLIAQATIEGVPILTADPAFRRYAIKVLWYPQGEGAGRPGRTGGGEGGGGGGAGPTAARPNPKNKGPPTPTRPGGGGRTKSAVSTRLPGVRPQGVQSGWFTPVSGQPANHLPSPCCTLKVSVEVGLLE